MVKPQKVVKVKKQGFAGLHMISAWAASNQLVLGQEATKEKSNEITAIPTLLKLLELKSCIITVDAMGCQLKIAEQIIKQEADYVFGLKGNQGLLHKDVIEHFKTALATDFKVLPHDFYEETEKKHGRYDVRKCWIVDAPKSLHRVEGLTNDWHGRT